MSALVAIVYITVALVMGGVEASCKAVLFLIMPMACIWFSEAMGGYTGLTTSVPITTPSPGIMVCIAGWLVLLFPVVLVIVA